eukprot:CAMPEP_0201488972 /NCGR_PEP_ID=MMETSP0151_2-20130828/20808_1 /ASSEMBLY_ACC=CAM_ASM_000257 /TAXON_ID=200890 /ORGANISM="Paramoeba atlantica, Strain 621/1 / CCAP 1560/9" /LENGTH=72 /DNA_ID=CAMNT_0047874421 /DNA_START=88 /DNA_END=303 /DNA_ORIENTATION=-
MVFLSSDEECEEPSHPLYCLICRTYHLAYKPGNDGFNPNKPLPKRKKTKKRKTKKTKKQKQILDYFEKNGGD